MDLGEQYAKKLNELIITEKVYLYEKFSLDDVAKRLGTNRSYAARIVVIITGSSLYALLCKMRVEESIRIIEEIIKEGRRPTITIVAYRCGFRCARSFTRNFRRLTGMDAMEYIESQYDSFQSGRGAL